MRWAWCVALGLRNAYKILVRKHKQNIDHLEDLDVDGRIILK
jgi:hypothetical protein